jgi:hypothetical protein
MLYAALLSIAITQDTPGVPRDFLVRDGSKAQRIAEAALTSCGLKTLATVAKVEWKRAACTWTVAWDGTHRVDVGGQFGDFLALTWCRASQWPGDSLVSDAERLERARKIATEFGMPAEAKGELRPNDLIRFTLLPPGHKFPALVSEYRIDRFGRLDYLSQNWRMIVDSDKAKITLQNAIKIAGSYYEKKMRSIGLPPDQVDSEESGLGYVWAGKYPHVRLAWHVLYRWPKVFVDAVSGKILGDEMAYKL